LKETIYSIVSFFIDKRQIIDLDEKGFQ